MIVEYTRNPNEVLHRMYLGSLSGPRAERYPIAFTHSHCNERVVTHPERPFNVAYALRQSLQGILQLKGAIEQSGEQFEDGQTLHLSYGRESQIILYASKNELHLQLTHHYLDLSAPNIFEVASVYTSLIHEYAAAKLGRRVGTHTHVVCVLKAGEADEKLANSSDRLSVPTERAIGLDFERFEIDTGMLVSGDVSAIGFKDRFVRRVAVPVFLTEAALTHHRTSDALVYAKQCQAEDWQIALQNWIKEHIR